MIAHADTNDMVTLDFPPPLGGTVGADRIRESNGLAAAWLGKTENV